VTVENSRNFAELGFEQKGNNINRYFFKCSDMETNLRREKLSGIQH